MTLPSTLPSTPPSQLASTVPSTLHPGLTTDELVAAIPGPIVVTGVGGFVGAHLAQFLQARREDVFGTARSPAGWRFETFGLQRRFTTPGIGEVLRVLESVRPRTIFNLAAHGAYSFQTSSEQIAQTNFSDLIAISQWAEQHDCAIVQAGSSSEYGWNCAGPPEDSLLQPNSLYAVTKAAASHWLGYRSRVSGLAACVLRLYSVYGPGEDPARLFPSLVRSGLAGDLLPLAAPEVSHDFIFVDDVVEAFARAGALVRTEARGAILNVGTGTKTSMADVARLAIGEFGLAGTPVFGDVTRPWDLQEWFGDPQRAQELIGWQARTPLAEGLHRTRSWYEAEDHKALLSPEMSVGGVQLPDPPVNVSAVIACYRDAQAIPVMYERLKTTFTGLGLTFEIIFVNDASPDNALQVIEELSLKDSRVKGITHSRNFGSQSAFLSGMKESVGEHVVLLDGDLQDPPEVIAEFWATMQQGFDVVYGRRAEREATWFMRRASRAFYRVFQALAPFDIPRDAGDFSLMSREVVDVITSMPERDLFIRAQRAYAGFRQTGVDYKRPERMFGRTTNNLGKNVGWATRGVLAVSRAPLTGLSLVAVSLALSCLFLIVVEVVRRVFFPDFLATGLVSVRVLVLGLGALNLLAVAIVGEYVGRILEETKKRPRYVRRLITEGGVTQSSAGADQAGATVDGDPDS